MITVIVAFFDNRREARNTLHSLTAEYQAAAEIDYEVIALDNGSTQPLDPSKVTAFGPQFHYRFVETRSKSPAGAINAAAREANGEHLVVMIDGAHIVTPRVLQGMRRAFDEFESPFVATPPFHLGPKIQNQSVTEGYNQGVEDDLLERSGWKADGYQLYLASRSFADKGGGWFGCLPESGCVGLRKSSFLALGGFDERFESPGGGLVNLDFFERAVTSDSLEYVMLLGEATFHQFHGGVASNAPVADHPYPRFSEEYRRIRGKHFAPPLRRPYFIGHLPEQALPAAAASAAHGLIFWQQKGPAQSDLFAAGKGSAPR